MKPPKDVKLRPHHIARVAHFYNLSDTVDAVLSRNPNYSDETAKRIAAFMQTLFDNPDTPITVVGEPDDICKLCDNYDGKGCTISTEESISKSDEHDMFDYRIDKKRYLVREVRDMRSMSFGMHI